MWTKGGAVDAGGWIVLCVLLAMAAASGWMAVRRRGWLGDLDDRTVDRLSGEGHVSAARHRSNSGMPF